MNRRKIFHILALTILALQLMLCSGAAEMVKIMPIGDSITRGGGFPIGAIKSPTYRYYLYTLLSSAGWQVDYVGPFNGVGGKFNTGSREPYEVPPQYQLECSPYFVDQDMAGSTGWEIHRYFQTSRSAKTLMEKYDPDIVLIHLGTNDVGSGESPEKITGEVDQLIELIRSGSSHVKIFVAQIIPLLDNAYTNGPGNESQVVQEFNALLPGLITKKNSVSGFPAITLVDMWKGFDPKTLLAEKTHPNGAGDREMARRWFQAVTAQSKAPSFYTTRLAQEHKGTEERAEEPVKPSKAQKEAERTLKKLKARLEKLQGQYTDGHPDVVRLKRRIEKLQGSLQ